jgi:hypothetical protein
MSEPWLPEPAPSDAISPAWLCPECGSILGQVRPTEDGWVGLCQRHGPQLGVQFDSQVSENPPGEEELDDYDA